MKSRNLTMLLLRIAMCLPGMMVSTIGRADVKPVPSPTLQRQLDSGQLVPTHDGKHVVVVPSSTSVGPYCIELESNQKVLLQNTTDGDNIYRLVVNPAGDKAVGIVDQNGGKEQIAEWNLRTGRQIGSRTTLPDECIYCSCLRWGSDGTVYVGAHHRVYFYSPISQATGVAVSDCKYLILDVARRKQRTAYVDQSLAVQLSSVARPNEQPVKSEIVPLQKTQLRTVDLSDDEAEVVFGGATLGGGGEISRVNLGSGEIQTVLFPSENVECVRYIGRSKNVLVQTNVREKGRIRFGFWKSESHEIEDFWEVDRPISEIVMKTDGECHLTIGLVNGSILQWGLAKWPETWKNMTK